MILVVFDKDQRDKYGGNIELQNSRISEALSTQYDRIQRYTANASKKGNRIRKYALDRTRRIVTTASFVCRTNSVNERHEIWTLYASYLPESDLIALLINAVILGRYLMGSIAFIELLAGARVPPELITNENVKQELIQPRL